MDLYTLYKEGFAPGPSETEDFFKSRIVKVRGIFKAPFILEKLSPLPLHLEPISPSFPFFRSSKKLPFWFGAMTWICEIEKGIKVAVLQLPLKKRFSWTREEEFIAHEKVHALRSSFSESRFEEILAYRTSPTFFRRFLGPLFQKPIESYLFLLSSFLAIVSPFIPLLFFLFLFIRLSFNQRVFHKALKKLSKETAYSEEVIRLFTDKEISLTAKGEFSKLPKNSLRWKQIEAIAEKGLTTERGIDI